MKGRITSLLLAFAFLAGCTSNGGHEHGAEPIELEVVSASYEYGRCGDGVTQFDEGCHEIIVMFNNSLGHHEMDTTSLMWRAMDIDGNVIRSPLSNVPVVEGGQTSTIILEFTTPDKPSRLATLRYQNDATEVEVDIPKYLVESQ